MATEEVTLSSLTHPLQQQDEDIGKITFCIKSRGVICFSLLKFFTLKAGEERVGPISTLIYLAVGCIQRGQDKSLMQHLDALAEKGHCEGHSQHVLQEWL